MTREEMALAVEEQNVLSEREAQEIAAELRKKCAGCKRFDSRLIVDEPVGWCMTFAIPVPNDGSGFCHRWESQPAGKD